MIDYDAGHAVFSPLFPNLDGTVTQVPTASGLNVLTEAVGGPVLEQGAGQMVLQLVEDADGNALSVTPISISGPNPDPTDAPDCSVIGPLPRRCMMRRFTFALLIVSAGAVLPACGSSKNATSTPTPAAARSTPTPAAARSTTAAAAASTSTAATGPDGKCANAVPASVAPPSGQWPTPAGYLTYSQAAHAASVALHSAAPSAKVAVAARHAATAAAEYHKASSLPSGGPNNPYTVGRATLDLQAAAHVTASVGLPACARPVRLARRRAARWASANPASVRTGQRAGTRRLYSENAAVDTDAMVRWAGRMPWRRVLLHRHDRRPDQQGSASCRNRFRFLSGPKAHDRLCDQAQLRDAAVLAIDEPADARTGDRPALPLCRRFGSHDQTAARRRQQR